MPGMRQNRKNPNSFNGVVPGSPSTINMPQDRGGILIPYLAYEEDGVKANKATMIAGVPSFELQINGDKFSEYHTEDVLMLNEFYGEPFEDGILPLYFVQDQRITALEGEMNVFIPAAHSNPQMVYNVAEGATNPTMTQWLVTEGIGEANRQAVAVTPAKGANRIIKHWRKTVSIDSSGETRPTTFTWEGSPNELIRALHFQGDNITRLDIRINDQEFTRYEDRDVLNHLLTRAKVPATPQADTWHIAFETLGGSANAMYNPTFGAGTYSSADRLEVDIYTSTTANVNLLAELYARPAVKG